MLQGVVARGTARGSPRCRPTSPARPAPATSSTTPGSPASATTSPSRSGSATTTPRASARSATATPARKVALPIFERIMQAVWAQVAPQTALPGPSPRGRAPSGRAADRRAIGRAARRPQQPQRLHRVFPRWTPSGQLTETQYRLVVARLMEYGVGDDDARPARRQLRALASALRGVRRQRDYDGSPIQSRGSARSRRRPPDPAYPTATDAARAPERAAVRRRPGYRAAPAAAVRQHRRRRSAPDHFFGAAARAD